MYCGHARLCVYLSVCLSVCLSAAACLHYCTDPDVTWGSGRGCPLVVHHWADLQSMHGLRCYGNTSNAWQSPAVIRQAHHTPHPLCHALRMPAKTPLASANIDAPAGCAVPFRPYCGDVVMRTRNVSEYMLVLTLCLVEFWQCTNTAFEWKMHFLCFSVLPGSAETSYLRWHSKVSFDCLLYR